MLFCLRNVPYLLMWPPLDRGTENTASGKEIHWFITSALERIIDLEIRRYWIHRNTNTVARFTHIHISHYHWGSHLDSGCEAHIYIPSVRLTHVYIPSVGLTHIYIPGVRLTHTWITTVRLTRIYINIVRLTHLYINIICEAQSLSCKRTFQHQWLFERTHHAHGELATLPPSALASASNTSTLYSAPPSSCSRKDTVKGSLVNILQQ